jgi:hypothetical protein
LHFLHKAVPGCTLLTPGSQTSVCEPQSHAAPPVAVPLKRNKQTVKFVSRNIHSILSKRRQVSLPISAVAAE